MESNLTRLEDKIRQAALPENQRNDLLRLAQALRSESEPLVRTDPEKAESIAGFAHVAAHESLRKNGNAKSKQIAQDGLISSVEEFEKSHPVLVKTVSGLCEMLSNIGI